MTINLLELTKDNTCFSNVTPGLQLAWDASSIEPLKTCPRKYYYTNVLGLRPRVESIHLVFGTLLHIGNEVYSKQLPELGHEQAVKDAVRAALVAAGKRVEETTCNSCGSVHRGSYAECPDCQHDDLNHRTFWEPWQSDDNNKNLPNAIKTLVWYFERFKHDWLKTITLTNGQPAVELSFVFETDLRVSLENSQYLFCGRMDRIAEFSSDPWVVDVKSTKYTLYDDYFNRYDPNTQMSMYPLAAHIMYKVPVRGVIIDAAQIGVNFSRFKRGTTFRDSARLEEWTKDTYAVIKQNEKYVEDQYWPQNDAVCGLYGGCVYREVCSKSPSTRQMFLDGNFVHRPWDPMKTREI